MTYEGPSSSVSGATFLTLLLMVIISGLPINTQKAFAAAWSTKIEEWLNGDAARWTISCGLALKVDQYIRHLGNPEATTLHDKALAVCDTNLLVIYKDVCPSHDNGFKICGEPMVYQYLSERKLLSAKTPMEWKIPTPEEQDAANALIRNAINAEPIR